MTHMICTTYLAKMKIKILYRDSLLNCLYANEQIILTRPTSFRHNRLKQGFTLLPHDKNY